MNRWTQGLQELKRYPSALGGLAIILFLIALSFYTVITIPYSEALEQWRGGDHWRMHPVNASPLWTDRLTGATSREPRLSRVTMPTSGEARFEGGKQVRIPLNFSYNNEGFPSELNLFLEQRQSGKEGFVRLTWHRPNGETINLGGQRIGEKERVSISQNSSLEGRLGMVPT